MLIIIPSVGGDMPVGQLKTEAEDDLANNNIQYFPTTIFLPQFSLLNEIITIDLISFGAFLSANRIGGDRAE